ncbi:hypothetical protein [Paenibacillus psychroresistens]|nr:hypothetical protein [Paenibacillus psychroresistens]
MITVDEIQRKKYRKKPRRNRNEKKDVIVKTVFTYLVVSLIFVGLTSFSLYIVVPYWLDLPRLLTGNYAVISGTLNSYETTHTSGKSWGYNYYIKMDGIGYHTELSKDVYIGEKVTISFLPHTKVILKIK